MPTNKRYTAPDLVSNVRGVTFRARARPLTPIEHLAAVRGIDGEGRRVTDAAGRPLQPPFEVVDVEAATAGVVERSVAAEFIPVDERGESAPTVEVASTLAELPDELFDTAVGATARERFDDTLLLILEHLRRRGQLDP